MSAQRALETHCDRLLIAKSGVDGIYTADPKADPTATKIEALTFDEALAQGCGSSTRPPSRCARRTSSRCSSSAWRATGISPPPCEVRRIGTLVTAE